MPGWSNERNSFAYRARLRVANRASQIAISVAMFLETAEPQVPRPGHLFAHLETAERMPLRVTSLIDGTFATCRAHLEAKLDLVKRKQ